LVEFHEIWYGCNAIQGDFGAIIFNSKAAIVLKLLRLKFLSWMHDFQPCSAMIWDCLHSWVTMVKSHKSLADVTMATKACNLLYGKNDIKAVMLLWKAELAVAIGQKRPKDIAGFMNKGSMDMFRTA
jgi:hypothetical protein